MRTALGGCCVPPQDQLSRGQVKEGIVSERGCRYAIAENNDRTLHLTLTISSRSEDACSNCDWGEQRDWVGSGKDQHLSSTNIRSMLPFKVRGLCKQFKGEVYLTARDEARGKVKPPFIMLFI